MFLKLSQYIFQYAAEFQYKSQYTVNPLTTNVLYHIETSQLICSAEHWSLMG